MAICGYIMYGVLCDYDINFDMGTYLDENWSDTQKRPYNIHGLDDRVPYYILCTTLSTQENVRVKESLSNS
jgi:hypothetical protein